MTPGGGFNAGTMTPPWIEAIGIRDQLCFSIDFEVRKPLRNVLAPVLVRIYLRVGSQFCKV